VLVVTRQGVKGEDNENGDLVSEYDNYFKQEVQEWTAARCCLQRTKLCEPEGAETSAHTFMFS
jgi:hypothetical protein